MAKKQNRQSLWKSRRNKQRADTIEIDLTGDSSAEAKFRVDTFVRTTLIFLPRNAKVKVFIRSDPNSHSKQKSLLIEMYEYISQKYKQYILDIEEPIFKTQDNSYEGQFTLSMNKP